MKMEGREEVGCQLMCEGHRRVNLKMLPAVCGERRHCSTEVPDDNLGN